MELEAGQDASAFDVANYTVAVAQATGAPEEDVSVLEVIFDVQVGYSVPDELTLADVRAAIATASRVAETAVVIETSRRLSARRLAQNMSATVSMADANVAVAASAALAQPDGALAGFSVNIAPMTTVNVETSVAAAADGSVVEMPAPWDLSNSLGVSVQLFSTPSSGSNENDGPSPSPTPAPVPPPIAVASGAISWRPIPCSLSFCLALLWAL